MLSGTAVFLLGTLVALLCFGCSYRQAKGEKELERRHSCRQLYYLLARYAEDNGKLPAVAGDPARALYKLKDYAMSELPWSIPRGYDPQPVGLSAFDVRCGPYDDGPASWDDTARSVRNADFIYLNEPRDLVREHPEYALYAEKIGPWPTGRWVAHSNGALQWVSARNEHFRSPLGRSWAELQAANPARTHPPTIRFSEETAMEHAEGLAYLQLALNTYADDHHGNYPFSPEGGDAAMFLLKPYLANARAFDGPYSQLENGVAYWDDEREKVGNADVIYLNSRLPTKEWPYVVLAEKWGAYLPRVRTLTICGGMSFHVVKGTPHSEQPLGKSPEVFEIWWIVHPSDY